MNCNHNSVPVSISQSPLTAFEIKLQQVVRVISVIWYISNIMTCVHFCKLCFMYSEVCPFPISVWMCSSALFRDCFCFLF